MKLSDTLMIVAHIWLAAAYVAKDGLIGLLAGVFFLIASIVCSLFERETPNEKPDSERDIT